MKNLLKRLLATGLALLALAPLASAELIIPDAPEGYVLDEAEVLSEETETEIERQLSAFDAETSTQIVVVTMSSLQGYNIEEVSLEIARQWGVGQEEFDNGVVFLIAPNEREARIEVGRGLEGAIPDATAWLILDEVVIPHFANGDYEYGAIEGAYYIVNLAYDENFDISELQTVDTSSFLIFFAVFGMIFIWSFLSVMSQTKSWWAGGFFGALVAAAINTSIFAIAFGTLIGLLIDYVLSKYFYKKIFYKDSGFWGPRGGSSGGRSGGGFGGFGGGGFGGGGASGSW